MKSLTQTCRFQSFDGETREASSRAHFAHQCRSNRTAQEQTTLEERSLVGARAKAADEYYGFAARIAALALFANWKTKPPSRI